MDSDKGYVNLINESEMKDVSMLGHLGQKQKVERAKIIENQDNYQYPEIFQMGGNQKLNKKLYQQRIKKQQKMNELPIIQCYDLGKQYNIKGENPVIALKSISLSGNDRYGAIKRGEFVIIRGPSGGGKTTFLNILGTIDSSSHGSLKIQGKQIDSKSTDDELSTIRRQKIGIVFQTFNLLALMSAFQNIELPMRIKGKMREKDMKERTKFLLKRVGLSQRADHLPSQLSGGEQQRVAIARSLANSPSIILLDEPTGDLDSKSTIEVMNLLLEINNFGYDREQQNFERINPITIIMVTHNQDLQCYGDRVIFFEDGKIRKQVLNQYQFALQAEQYSAFLNTKV